MLLNEIKQQRAQMSTKFNIQAEEIRNLKKDAAELKELKQELRAASVSAQP
jgi:hypothetical protein